MVYPNPGTGVFNLRFDQATTGTVEIYNMLGEKVYQDELSEQVDLSGNAVGMYVIYVNTPVGVYTEKVFIKP